MSDHNLAEALRGYIEDYKSEDGMFDTKHYVRQFQEALAAHEAEQQAGEAVAVVRHGNIKPGIPWTDVMWLGTPPPNGTKLFTHPQQPLTREQIGKVSADAHIAFCLDKYPTYEVALARAIEAELGITKDTK